MKHCTIDKCPQILDSSCVFYEGASLIFSGVNTNDSVETVIQKLNLKLESLPTVNLNNYYNKTEIDILFNNIDQTKRPLKTINNESLEGSGNVQINYNDLDNLPTIVNDKNYVHNQIVASNFWEIQHNLDKYPSVSIIDSGNNLVVGEIKYIDSNNIIITFTSVFSGKAYFN